MLAARPDRYADRQFRVHGMATRRGLLQVVLELATAGWMTELDDVLEKRRQQPKPSHSDAVVVADGDPGSAAKHRRDARAAYARATHASSTCKGRMSPRS